MRDKIGGTSEIVKFKLEGVQRASREGADNSRKSFLVIPDRGPVYHIITPRKSNTAPVGEDFSLRKLYYGKPANDMEIEAFIRQTLKRLDDYNADVQRLSGKLREKLAESRAEVLAEPVTDRLSGFQNRLLDAFATADCLSLHYSKKRLSYLRLLTSIGLALVLLFLLYDELESNLMLPLYMIAFIGAYIAYYLASKGHYQDKYVDYRALAEGLKIQLYWSLCGIKLNVSEHYQFSHMDELHWIRYAITSCFDCEAYTFDGLGAREAYNVVNHSWIKGQDDYFKAAVQRKNKLLIWHERAVNILFLSSILFLTAITVLEFACKGFMAGEIPLNGRLRDILLIHEKAEGLAGETGYQELFVRSVFKIIMAVIAALIAFISNYTGKLALSEQAKNYSKMAKLFKIARERFGEALRADDHGAAEKIVFELGREALAENANWVLLHRERPLEVPK